MPETQNHKAPRSPGTTGAMKAGDNIVPPHVIRARFSAAMSDMYRKEVPLYGRLLKLVRGINEEILAANPELERELGNLDRVSEERHGAIRLGTARELRTIKALFGVMAMHPVGYYDLSVAGLPVHSTAFRPIEKEELARNPFRVFTSLLRTDLLEDEVRQACESILERREIFSPGLKQWLRVHDEKGGFTGDEVEPFLQEALKTFRWHAEASVDRGFYERLLKVNGLVADIVCFRGPHINHLTPRVLDIHRLHQAMETEGIESIPEVQGPPAGCPILLKQTSFKALDEKIKFPGADGGLQEGTHRARFGEIELRDCAITPAAREIYDRLILQVNREAGDVKKSVSEAEYRQVYPEILTRIFREGFPAWSLEELRTQGLGYFHYQLVPPERAPADATPVMDENAPIKAQLEAGIQSGWVEATPITYEDFLPVSAAGIFKSNLDEASGKIDREAPNQALFEEDLDRPVLDPFRLYQEEQEDSIREVCRRVAGQD